MVDKLVLLSRDISEEFLELAKKKGQRRFGYRHVLDLRETPSELPIILYVDGRWTGINKVEIVGVARLGLQMTRQVLRKVIPNLSKARIYRIDFCVDLLGVSVFDLAEACFVGGVQNYRIHRRRGALSFYIQDSKSRVVVLYDKGKELAAKRNPLARILRPGDVLSRIEVQLKGSAVQFEKFRDIHGYLEVALLGKLNLFNLRPSPKPDNAIQFLAAAGLRYLIRERGLQAVAKLFKPPQWAFVKRKFLVPRSSNEMPDLEFRMKKSLEDWLNDRIRFPRGPKEDEE